jgi:hypothetical protein
MQFKISKRQLIKWSAISVVAIGAFIIYTSDNDAPVLESVSFSRGEMFLDGEMGLMEFDGRVTDARGINSVQLHCIESGQTKIMIHLAITGANRNRVSFGLDETTYNWRGSWKGTRYDLSFGGIGRIPPDTQSIACDWYSSLRDELGNSSWEPIGLSFQLVN